MIHLITNKRFDALEYGQTLYEAHCGKELPAGGDLWLEHVQAATIKRYTGIDNPRDAICVCCQNIWTPWKDDR